MTSQEILEAQSLIAGIRDDLSLIASTTDVERLIPLVLEKTEHIRLSFLQFVSSHPSILNGVEDPDVAQSGWMAMKAYAELAQDRPEHKAHLFDNVSKLAHRIEAILDKIEQALKLKQPPNPKAGG
jgi:hypothetical protein